MSADAIRRQLLAQLIREQPAVASAPVRQGEPRIEPSSFAQRRLWFIEQLQQAHAPYTLHALQHLHFAVDAALLEEALREVVQRHEALRTAFDLQDGEVVQRIAAEGTVTLRQVDLTAVPPEQRYAEAKTHMARTLGQRFDLRRGPLLRAELYRIHGEEFLLLLAVHHIVFDWQSFQVFFQEVNASYAAALAGQALALPPPSEQYADFAREQRARLTPARIASEAAFWRKELAGLPMLDLPLDRPRPRLPSFRGGLFRIELPENVIQPLKQRAMAAQTTLFTVLLAGLGAAFGRVCRQNDFAFGLPVTGRDTPARQQAVGFFVDTHVVRLRWSDDPTAQELLLAARDAMRRVLAHRDLPFDLLVQQLQIERDVGVNPLFQVGFQLMEYAMSHADSYGLDPERLVAMFDLCIDLWPHADGGLQGRVQYNADIFDAATAEILCQAFTAALHWLAAPDARLSALAFDALSPAPPPSVLAGQAMPLAEQSCLDVIEAMAARHPDAIALEDADERLSYRALLQRVEAVAGMLAGRGVQAGAIVVLELPRSLSLIVTALGVLRAGAAFACIDPTWPAERRARIRARTAAPLVVNADALQALLRGEAAAPARRPQQHDMAYVIHTSGSTGEPKGVVLNHLGLLNVALAQQRTFGLGPGRRVAQLASPTFDASVFEVVLALCSGATLVVAPPGIVAGEALAAFVNKHAVDTLVVPPSVLATTEPERCPGLRLVCVAGESCPADLAERFGAGREFWNLYGPTETTIWATAGRAVAGAKVSIGQPIPNLCTAVVDEQGRAVPVGMAGELCVAGAGLARGYLHEPEQTDRAFVPIAPHLAESARALGFEGRMYRTGDLVRQLRSGELVFLGRTDRQVKVRGLRIEPEEIERVLRKQPEVSEVLVDVAVQGGPVLVAYLQTVAEDRGRLFDACRERLRMHLPAYMCPSHFVALPELPRTTSGKIDRKALPPPVEDGAGALEARLPATETERIVVDLVRDLLHRPRVSVDDDFFRIGGHSLAAAQLVARVQASLGVELSITEVFTHSTVFALAARIDAVRAHPPEALPDEVPLVRLPRERRAS